MRDLSDARWNKSSRSGAGNNCIEVADLGDAGHGVRDSKNPTAAVLVLTTAQWDAFTAGVRTDKFD